VAEAFPYGIAVDVNDILIVGELLSGLKAREWQ
jgi:hypothetical protein